MALFSKSGPPQIPDHELIRCVGKGSYGEVWLARSVMGTYRAVKIVHRKTFEESRPFDREFEGIHKYEPVSRTHPGLVAVLHVGRNIRAGYFYYVMEVGDDVATGQTIHPENYVPMTLRSEMTRRGKLPLADGLQISLALTAALGHLHEQGLIHRDIKPSNIIFVNGTPKFADIGLVTDIRESATYLGTPGYMPPEGLGNPTADIYSLGKMLYEMMTGKDRQDCPALPTDVAEGGPAHSLMRFIEIILKACDDDARKRFQSAGEMNAALAQAGPGGTPSPMSAKESDSTVPMEASQPAATLNQPNAAVVSRRLEGERKQVTVLASSVNFSEGLDPEETHARYARCFELIQAEIQHYEGTVAQVLNDGVLALFGAPVAHEDHPQRALHAALAIHRTLAAHADELKQLHQVNLQVRSGLSTGLLLVGSGANQSLATGEAANLASRLMGVAAPGQILIGESMATAMGGYFVTVPAGQHQLPGRSEPVRAAQVTGTRDTRTRIEVVMRSGLSPYVGRARELSLLQERFSEAREGRGQVVLCVGEPGVGKSRIFLELRRSLEGQEVTWLHGRSISYGQQTAYLPITELLRQYFQVHEGDDPAAIRSRIDRSMIELGENLRPAVGFVQALLAPDASDETMRTIDVQRRKTHTFDALRQLLFSEARRRPTVVVVEDLHWIDKISEEFLGALAESMAVSRILLLVNHRPGYKGPFPDATFVTRLMLNRLSNSESERLANGILTNQELPTEVRQLIAAKAEGNPFFVEELLKSLFESGTLRSEGKRCVIARPLASVHVPDTVQDVLMSRIDRLEPAPRKVLQLASVIGREFTVNLLQTISEMREPMRASLQKLQNLELIYELNTASEPAFVFKHALTQDVAYQSLLIQRRRELHRLVAASIEEIYQARLPEFYSLLGYHYERGEEWERALDYLVRAAARSHGVAAFREEVALLTQAMAIAERLNRKALLAELRGRRGSAWYKVGAYREARPDFETALAELPPERVELRAELLTELAGACFWALDIPNSRRYAVEGQPLAEQVGRSDLVAGLMGWQGTAYQSDGDLVAAIEIYERAATIGGGIRSPSLGNYSLVLYWRGKIDDAVRRGRESEDMYRQMNDSLAATFGRPHFGLALAASGQYDAAARVFAEVRRIGVKYEVWPFVARGIAMSAGFHLDVFDYKGNEELAEEAREKGRLVNFQPSVVSASLDLVFNYARRGEIAHAESLAAETAAAAEATGGWHRWLWDLRLTQARAEIAQGREDWPEALRWAEDSIARSRARHRMKYEVAGLVTRAMALAALGRKHEAIAELHVALNASRTVGDPAMILRVIVRLLAMEGNDCLHAEACAISQRTLAALPTDLMRQRFRDAEPIRTLGPLATSAPGKLLVSKP